MGTKAIAVDKFRQLTKDFFVAPQLVAADFPDLRARGFRTIINNRPDNEEPGQLNAVEVHRIAKEYELEIVDIPIAPGGILPDQVEALNLAISQYPGPHLAFCRSGTRSCYLWSFVAAQNLSPEAISNCARSAGYDLSSVLPLLEAIYTA